MADGLALGDADGIPVGLELGLADGDALGLADGDALGLFVGPIMTCGSWGSVINVSTEFNMKRNQRIHISID